MGESYGLWPGSPHSWELADPSRVCVLSESFLTHSQPLALSRPTSLVVSSTQCIIEGNHKRSPPQRQKLRHR